MTLTKVININISVSILIIMVVIFSRSWIQFADGVAKDDEAKF
jgi:flagellar biosynthesis component FlhA